MTEPAEGDTLRARLRDIEELPLPDRAAALQRLHDELRSALEAGDDVPAHA